MSKTRIASTRTLQHLFLDVPPPWLGYIEISLHTAQPGNNQTDNEVNYDGYARVKRPRNSSNWRVEDIEGVETVEASNIKEIAFPSVGKNSNQPARFVGIGSGNELIHIAELDEAIDLTRRIIPIIEAGQLKIREP